MAERVGFEPTVPRGITGFQDQLLKPLGHLSELRPNRLDQIILTCKYPIVKMKLNKRKKKIRTPYLQGKLFPVKRFFDKFRINRPAPAWD